MFLSDLSIKRPVMMSMLLVALLLFGFIGYSNLPLTLMPNFKIPYVTVQTIYAGTAPQEIESQITKKIEDEVSSISLVDEMYSYSLEGVSIVQIKFEMEKDEDVALQDVKDKVDQILNDLPAGADRPVIQKLDVNATSVMDIVMEGDLTSTELYDVAKNKIKDRIAQIAGVGKVDVLGGAEREIRVELDTRAVYENNLSLTQVSNLLRTAHVDMPGGHMNAAGAGQEYTVRLKGEFPTLDALRNFDIPTSNGIKKLWQLAAVKDSNAEVRKRVTYFNNPLKKRSDDSVLLTIVKNPLGNTVKVVDAVTKLLPEIEKEVGNGISLTVVQEEGTFVKNAARDSLGNIYQGILLTALILLLFLHDFRSMLIIVLSMPMSIIPTFIIMQAIGNSLNVMSLMGLSTASGLLTANSVVVLENIFRRKGLGEDRIESASKGTAEVAVAVFASTLTNIVVFGPIASMSGIVGQIFRDFALTVVISTVFSIFSSFTVTPMLASLILPEKIGQTNRFGMAFDRFFGIFEKAYRKLLQFILANKKRSLLVIVVTALLFVGAMLFLTKVPFDLVPAIDNNKIQITVELPQGYDLKETAVLLRRIEDRIKGHREVVSVLTNLGKISKVDEGVNMAKMDVKLVKKATRTLTDTELATIITKELADLPNAAIKPSAISGFQVGNAPVDFYLTGPNLAKVEQYSAELISKVKKIPGVMNADTSSRMGKPEITLYPDRVKMATAGLTVQELALLLRTAVEGMKIAEYKENNNNYDIRVVLNKESIPSYEDLNNLPVYTRNGVFPISKFAKLKFTNGYNKVLHYNKQIAVEFTADMLPGYALGDITSEVEKVFKELKLPAGYRLAWTGKASLMNEMMGNMAFAFGLAILLTFMLLAATLENFGQPLQILLTVPLCMIGVVAAMAVTGTSLSMVSTLSIVMLVGIVVNNAILILDYANQLRSEGKNMREALLEACPIKLKAIVMSNLAAILGMLPMAMGIGASAVEARQPMGIVSIGGIVSSTLLTLVVIPALEILVSKNRTVKKSPEITTEAGLPG
jgi:HAE1 family hydrophobic/amphiphilic exporter-1